MKSRRSGLTLIELIVVLVILVGLAGIVIPLLPNMLGRAHTSAGATNMQEITKWVQTYEQLYLTFPDEWDSLTDGSDVVSYLPRESTSTPVVGGYIKKLNLTQPQADALRIADEITSVPNLSRF